MGNYRPGIFNAASLVVVAAALTSVLAQTSQLRLVSTVWPPFTNVAGQPRFALDLVETALDRIGIKSETTFVDAAQFTPSLLTGSFDGSGAAWKDAERERVLLFSQPYLENRLILVARSGSDVSATALTALKGKRIAVVEGYAYGDAVESAGPTYVRSKSEEDSLRLLLDGAVDYVLMDDLVVQYILSNHPEEAKTRLQVGTTPLITRPLYFAVRRSVPDAQSIIDRFNAQLTTMISDRTYHRLLHVDWLRADIDGDGIAEYIAGSDRSGPAEPQRVYNLFSSTDESKPELRTTPRRYFFGGNIYSGWQTVPNQFKTWDNVRTDPSRSAFRVFTFTWK